MPGKLGGAPAAPGGGNGRPPGGGNGRPPGGMGGRPLAPGGGNGIGGPPRPGGATKDNVRMNEIAVDRVEAYEGDRRGIGREEHRACLGTAEERLCALAWCVHITNGRKCVAYHQGRGTAEGSRCCRAGCAAAWGWRGLGPLLRRRR